MSAGWFAFMDELSGLVSGCRLAGGFCIVGCRGGFELLVGGVWGFALRLVYIQLFGGCGGVVFRVVAWVELARSVFNSS